MPSIETEKVTLGSGDATTDFITLPSGFRFKQADAKAHVMEPDHTRGVVSSRGLEEGTKLQPRILPAGMALSFNTDGFVAPLNPPLAVNTAGDVMQLRHHALPLPSPESG